MQIGSLSVANRICLSPIAAHSPLPDGNPSEETLAFFELRAKSGVGLIILGGTMATDFGWKGMYTTRFCLRLDHDDFLPGLQRLVARVHKHGVPFIAQLGNSFGRMGKPGDNFVAASPVAVTIAEDRLAPVLSFPGGVTMPTPREATKAEIATIVDQTVEAARRMKRAGFDGVDLPAHVSYFLASFLSHRTNLRTDQYGGSLENRGRIVVELIQRIKLAAGPDFVVGVRMAGSEPVAGGQQIDDSLALAKAFERAGADYIALTVGGYENVDLVMEGRGYLVRSGEGKAFRDALHIPVLLQGIHDPAQGALAITSGHCDMLMLGRSFLADAAYMTKLRLGQPDTIVRCDRNNSCVRRLMLQMPIKCSRNPALGRWEAAPPTLAMRLKDAPGSFFERLAVRAVATPWLMRMATAAWRLIARKT